MSMRKVFLFILPVCLWLSVIFTLSAQPYKEQSIQPFLKQHFTRDAVRDKLPDVKFQYHTSKIDAKKDPFRFVEFLFRKAAHLFEYGMLAVFVYLTLIPYRPRMTGKGILVLLAVGLVAMADEWVQLKIPGRTSAIEDIGIDLIGGCIGLLSVMTWHLYRRKIASKSIGTLDT